MSHSLPMQDLPDGQLAMQNRNRGDDVLVTYVVPAT